MESLQADDEGCWYNMQASKQSHCTVFECNSWRGMNLVSEDRPWFFTDVQRKKRKWKRKVSYLDESLDSIIDTIWPQGTVCAGHLPRCRLIWRFDLMEFWILSEPFHFTGVPSTSLQTKKSMFGMSPTNDDAVLRKEGDGWMGETKWKENKKRQRRWRRWQSHKTTHAHGFQKKGGSICT